MGLVVKTDKWRIPNTLWEKMEPLLPPGKPHPLGCHRPRVPNRDAMNAIFFVLRTGCQWNALNVTGICSSSSAHRRFLEWTEAGVFTKFWKAGLLKYNLLKGINWSWLSMDGSMTKAPLGGKKTGLNPTDRAKSGTKRSVVTDGKGIPLGIVADGANRHDIKLARETLENIQVKRPKPTRKKKQNLCLDAGYVGNEVQALTQEFGFTAHVRPRGEEAQEIKRSARKKARRWVVERTNSWLNRFRALLIRWSKRADAYIALLHLACGIITWRSTGLMR
ncbi:TPA: IS5 family transposase [Candidatus Woesearchaeota archaeon]|nr:IS5 family transposase [Candidatus Woesearchaeota archaeon]